jgi:phosphohistidine phosphatase SixA
MGQDMDHSLRFTRQRFIAGVLAGLAVQASSAKADDSWQGFGDGRVVAIMRHAAAPGTGDPRGFTLDECTTQRNLSDAGRSQARAIGAMFRAHGGGSARVFSSRWCRSMETARLLQLGRPEPLEYLDSFFAQPDLREGRTQGLLAWLHRQDRSAPIILVTHQVNVTALTGVFPASGEIILARRHGQVPLPVAGRIRPPDP